MLQWTKQLLKAFPASYFKGKDLRSKFPTMRNRTLRPLAMVLSLLLMASMPVQAGPITFNQVVQVLADYKNTDRVPDLRLRHAQQGSPVSEEKSASSAGTKSATKSQGSIGIPDASRGATTNSSDSLLAGVSLKSDDPQGNVDVISQGDLEGSICDCGEILGEETPFPKWPLVFLAAIPFFFIDHDCDTCSEPTPTPTPPTPPCTNCNTVVPEPASLILFGSGLAALAAGLRRRYARVRLEKQIATPTEGQ